MGDGYGEWSQFYLLDVKSKSGRVAMLLRCVLGGLVAEHGLEGELHAMDDQVPFDYSTLLTRSEEFFVCNIPTPDPNQGPFATQEVHLRIEKDGSPSSRRIASRNRGLSVSLVELTQREAELYNQRYGITKLSAA